MRRLICIGFATISFWIGCAKMPNEFEDLISRPVLYSPTNQQLIKDNTPSFNWSDVTDASMYELLVDNSSSFSSPEIQQSDLTSSEYTVPVSLADGTYYWKVRAKDSNANWGEWSNVFSFTIDTRGVPPVLLSPLDGSTLTNNKPVFDWTDVSDASAYEIIVDNSINFESPEIDQKSLTLSTYSAVDSLPLNTYYWKVRSQNNSGVWSAWSEAWSFTIVHVQLISIGTTITGSLAGKGDVCYYWVNITGKDALMLMFRGSKYTTEYDVKLRYGSLSGSEVGVKRSGGNYVHDLTIEVISPSAGDYYIEIRDITDGSQTFDLLVETLPVEALNLNQQLDDKPLWGYGDVRYYKVSMSGTDALMLMFRGSKYTTEYDVKLRYGSLSSSEVGVKRSGGNYVHDLTIEVTSPSAGDYYIEIRDITDGSQTFDLLAETRPVEALSLNQQLNAKPLWGCGDVRYYKVSVNGTAALILMFRGSEYATKYDVKLRYGSLSSSEVGVKRSGGSYVHDLTIEVVSPSTGDYYIEIRDKTDGSQTFDLLAETRPVEALNLNQPLDDKPLWGYGDVRYYKVSMSGTDALMLMFRGSEYTTKYDVKLRYGSLSSSEVGVKRSGGNYVHDLTIEVTSPSAGDYYIEIRDNTDGSQTFDLLMETRPIEALNLNQQLNAKPLWGCGDVRYYKVSVSGIDTLLLIFKGSEYVTKYDVKLRYGSLSSSEVGVKRSGGNYSYDLTIEVASPIAGDYYIEIRDNTDGSQTFDLIVKEK